jgi:hypothetical protein
MITHECLPLNPQHKDSFEIPGDIQVHAGAFVSLYIDSEPVGEAAAFNKVPVMSNLWTLHRVITPSSVTLTIDTEINVHTTIRNARWVTFEDGFGWYVSAYDPNPIAETVYIGKVASVTGPVFAAGKYSVYELLGFRVTSKGETK